MGLLRAVNPARGCGCDGGNSGKTPNNGDIKGKGGDGAVKVTAVKLVGEILWPVNGVKHRTRPRVCSAKRTQARTISQVPAFKCSYFFLNVPQRIPAECLVFISIIINNNIDIIYCW